MQFAPTPAAPWRPTAVQLTPFAVTYIHLLGVRCAAKQRRIDPRATAVPWQQLLGPRMFPDREAWPWILVWMQYVGHVAHLRSVANARAGEPGLAPAEGVFLTETSHLALTEAGKAFAFRFVDAYFGDLDAFAAAHDALWNAPVVPRYDRDNRALSWGGRELKRFRQPAINQHLILAAAEEQGWPAWFDDPLPRVRGMNPKVRLHDTIKHLNRNQRPYLIHFKGDGTGTRVGWEYR